MSNLHQSIAQYLKAWSQSVSAKPEASIVKRLRDRPEEAFVLITKYDGPRYHIDPRDIDDPLAHLLSEIADLVPHLLIPRMTEGFWASLYVHLGRGSVSLRSLSPRTPSTDHRSVRIHQGPPVAPNSPLPAPSGSRGASSAREIEEDEILPGMHRA